MSTNDFSPVEALRAIHRVCTDLKLTPAQRIAIVRVVLWASNETGLAWAGYRTITKETGLAPATIRAALRYAEGRYLSRHAVGQNGAIQYRVALQPVKRVSKSEAPGTSQDEAPALQTALSGASACEAKLTPVTNPKTDPIKARRNAPPDPRVKQFIDWFAKEYQTALGRPYVVTGGKDGATVKRLLLSLSLEELQEAAKNMLADSWAKDRADIGLLAGKINSWRGGADFKRPGTTGRFTLAKASDGYSDLARTF